MDFVLENMFLLFVWKYENIYIYAYIMWDIYAGGGRNFRVMGSFQTGFQGGVGTAFPSAATFPHYAIQQGIPYNLYGYVCLYF